ncbi:MAG: flagellar export protein FliJ [Oceanospirillaceae bacterium]|nr:flagellar export protein FliJ [Oceanospirillaceae bacterium]MCP5350085.1 flagellar export protein FliJ [Oceanospirillaceae bacterium]
MSRERAKRLAPLLKLAAKAEQDALLYLGQLQQKLKQEEQRRADLLNYQREYQQNFKEMGSKGITGSQLIQHQAFMTQIDSAMQKQAQHLSIIEQQILKAKSVYYKLHQRHESYKKLETRLNEQAIASENQQLQKLLDEIGLQLHLRH